MALKNNKYQSVYIEGIKRYFFEYERDPEKKGIPQLSEFARKIGVTVRTLENWAKKHPAFGEAYEACMDKQQELLINKGLEGEFNPKIVQLLYEARANKERGTGETTIVIRHERADEEGKIDTEGAAYGG